MVLSEYLKDKNYNSLTNTLEGPIFQSILEKW